MDDLTDDQIYAFLESSSLETKPKTEECCINCKSDNIRINKDYIVCEQCGTIQQYMINKADKITDINVMYDASKNVLLPQSSLGTSINKGCYNRISRLQKWDQMPYKERSLYNIFLNIESNCRKFKISKAIIDNAKIFYKFISTQKNKKDKIVILRKVNKISLIAATVFFGAKLQKIPQKPDEIAKIFNINKTDLSKGCKKFIELMRDHPIYKNIKTTNSTDLIHNTFVKLNLKQEYYDIIIKILTYIEKLNLLSTHNPYSIAGTAVLTVNLYYKLHLTKRRIAELFDISDVTLAKTYNKIRKYVTPPKKDALPMFFNDKIMKQIFAEIELAEAHEEQKH